MRAFCSSKGTVKWEL